MYPTLAMNENAVCRQGKPRKFQADPAADHTRHKRYWLEHSPAVDNPNTTVNHFFHTHRTQAERAGQECPRLNDMPDISNWSTLPHFDAGI